MKKHPIPNWGEGIYTARNGETSRNVAIDITELEKIYGYYCYKFSKELIGQSEMGDIEKVFESLSKTGE